MIINPSVISPECSRMLANLCLNFQAFVAPIAELVLGESGNVYLANYRLPKEILNSVFENTIIIIIIIYIIYIATCIFCKEITMRRLTNIIKCDNSFT